MTNRLLRRRMCSLLIIGLSCALRSAIAGEVEQPPSRKQLDWAVYGGDPGQDRYSPLMQINRSNAHLLTKKWTFDAGTSGGLQDNPLVIGHRLFAYTSTEQVIALDAATGRKLWMFDSGTPGLQPSRGMSYWSDTKRSILFAGIINYLYALDPATGKTLKEFGDGGRIDLRKDLGVADIKDAFATMTSPGVVYKDMIIVGFRLPETKPALRGDIRAYDVHTGKLRWSFHTIPHPGEPGYDSWPPDAWKITGSANNWAGMALNEKTGIVYVPTGSAVDDFYGADRVGNDHFADTLLALDANTGKRIWDFQGVHHDIWDRDFPSPPSLLTVTSHGKQVEAVAQTTKQGFLYLFNQKTGEPLFPIVERPFPPSTVPGEKASPTQPMPLAPEPFARQKLTEDMLTQRTPAAHAYAVQEFRTFRSDGQFVPFSVDKQTIIFPGFDGGAEWGGSAVDVKTGVIYINANDIAWTGGLTENKPGGSLGFNVYQSQCSVCHGSDRKGSPPAFPSLVDIGNRLSDEQIRSTIHGGKGRMPAFPDIVDARFTALLDYLNPGENDDASLVKKTSSNSKEEVESTPGLSGVPARYRFTGYRKFYDQDGYPAVIPPWGTLNAIDLNTGKYLWKIPLGNYPELAAQGMRDTGTENYGGPVVTAGGVLFIGATIFDHQLRAFDSRTGALLWSGELPYAGNATPATYMVNGKQYVVIATSNSRNLNARQGASYVAFALP